MSSRGPELDPGAGGAQATQKEGSTLAGPFSDTMRIMDGLPPSTLKIILGKRGSKVNAIGSPEKPTDPDPLPPAA